MITKEFGSWSRYQRDSLTVRESVVTALGDVADDYDIDGLVKAWADAINEALPDGVTLAGDEFYGPAYPQDYAWEGNLDITEVIEGVDFWALAERHELWDIDRVAEHLGYTGKSAAGSARKTLSRLRVARHSFREHPDSGRAQAVYRSQDVRDAQAARPGRGNRTDLQNATDGES